jgi:hypothetical protein
MSETIWVLFGLLAGSLVFLAGRRWQRRQKASRLADVLLADVLKQKDSYRR